MSQIYNLEPATSGSVRLETTHGPLLLNLWTAEAPTTTKNFLQHCIDGYYNNLPFHRIIPGVLVQTGDPTRSGRGGVAALGDPAGYPRELHGRLKFRRRGLVAMVCEGGLARSQFFITLASAEWLNGEHSIFAEVAGDTIYNLLNIGENEVDGFDTPGAPRVKRVTVLEHPFKDLTARVVARNEGVVEQVVNAKRAVRRRNLLSFAGSDSEDEGMGVGVVVATPKRARSRFADAKDVVETVVKGGEDDDVIRKANEEFERLKAQLEGDETRKETEVPFRGNGKVVKRKRDESDTLKRLKAFENRVKTSRNQAKKNEHGRVHGAWFERGLRLATSVMEEEEYEVHFSTRKRGR